MDDDRGDTRRPSYRWPMTALVARDPDIDLWPLTRAQYDLLVDAGALEGLPVELLEGTLVWMAPQGEPHAEAIEQLNAEFAARLRAAFGRRLRVRPQLPLAATDTSEPEPDFAVVDADRVPGSGHPTSAHLVVEVTATSHRADLRHKPRIYAQAQVPVYWVVDLERRLVVVHREPGEGGYTHCDEVPFDGELDLLGLPVRLVDLLD